MYIYSVGGRLCGAHVRITDFSKHMAPSVVNCFHSQPGYRFSALAFHVYADLLYFSDVGDQLIRRLRMQTTPSSEHVQTVAANTGLVGGTLTFLTCIFCLCCLLSPPR